MRLAISLPLRNQQALTELLTQLQDPASPNYHKYLTPAQFAQRFGPTETDYAAVAAFAVAHGLTVTDRHANRTILDVEGSVTDIEKTFHVTMHSYRHPREPRQFYAPDSDPTVDLPVPLLRINGLDNYELPHPLYKIESTSPKANVASNLGSGPGGTYAGYDFRDAYAPGVSLTGSGQTVGLLEFDGYTPSDITYYENHTNLPPITPTNVYLDGYTGAPEGGEVEVSLDIEVAIAMAPGMSKLLVYEAGESGSWYDMLTQMADDNMAKQISCSWYIPGGTEDPTTDGIFQQMAAQGQSFFAAEGDDDAWTGLIPFPCDTPYITLVGGTMLNTTGPLGTYVSESVWNENNCYGSGGGISTQYPIPTWQQGINMTANLGSTTMRNTPDVAMTAINVYVQVDGESYTVGGTSCAAPLWAAFTSLINQQAVANDRATVGFINPAIYAIGKGSGYTADFHDTTVGNNFSSSSPAKFPAETGFDLCTGWGTPNGINLIYALAGPPAPVISTGSPLPDGAVGAAYTTTLAATGGVPPYTWAISAGNLPAGLTISSTTGTISGTPVASGTASFTVQVTGSNGFSSTTPFTLPIYAQGTPIIATASPLATGTVGSAYGQTLAASGGATPYSWSMASGNLPAGLALSSTGLVSGTPTATGSSQFTMTVTGSDGLASTSPFFMIVNPPPPAITGSLSITGTIGVPLSYPITATNNPTSFSATGLPAGLSLNTFTGVISGTATGTSNVTIAAANVSGSGTATLNIVISPDQLSYFTMSYISSPQISNAPFTVSITAYDVNNIVFAGYSGTLSLTGSGSTGFVPVSPATASDFVNGIWSGSVTVQGIASDVFLTANDGLGHSVTSDGFNIGSGPLDHFAWSVVGSPQQAAVPFPVTITAQDAGNNTVTSYSGTASLSCVGGGQSIGISPATTGAFTSGVWSGNVTLAQVAAGAILRATNGIVDFYIADSYNCTIRKMTAAGVVTTIAGTPVLQGTADGIGSAALFDHPYGVAVDGSGNIYVADTANSTIRKISPARVVTTIAGMPGISGTNDGAGSAARFNNPYGLTLDGSGNIYIGDTYNETIRKMTPAGVVITIGGTGGVTGTQGGVGPAAAFNAPEGLFVSPTNGAVYVADSANNRISEGIPNGGCQYTWSNFIGNPSTEGGTDGTGSAALLDNPIDVTLDGSGNLLVVSSNGDTVRRATPAGVVTTIAGVNATPGSLNGTGSTARFYAPNGVGLDLSGNAFVVDSAYSTIREVTPAGVVTTVAGSAGFYGFTDGTGANALFHFPNGGATDTGGDAGYSNPFTVTSIADLSVSPASGLSATGTENGPFAPVTTVYTISNLGTGPMNWTVSGTSGWLGFAPSGGTIASGTSTTLSVSINSTANSLAPGTYGDTMAFANTTNGAGNTSLPAALTVLPLPPQITSPLTAIGTATFPFSYLIAATNNPTSFNATGLPAGLTVNTATGAISGSTNVTGTTDATITATNAGGTGPAATLAIIMQVPPVPVITSTLSVTGTAGKPFTYQITASNNPSSFAASGLPAGLTVNTTTGVITGTTAAGASNVTISAINLGGTTNATLALDMIPDQLSYFTMASIASPQVANAPFTVTITAYDAGGAIDTGYFGALALSGSGSSGPVPVSPASIGGFVNGVLTANVSVQALAGSVVLTATDGAGHSIASNAFNVGSGPLNHFAWSAIGSPQQPLVPFAVTITAQDAGNNTVTSYSGTAALSCTGSGGTPIGISPAVTGTFTSGVWSGNISLAQTGSAAVLRATNGVVDFYIADSYNSTIRKMTAAGVVTTIAGTPLVQGTANGTGSAALFNHPYGVTVDGSGNIYVADTSNCTIRKITPAGVVTTIAGMPGISGTNDGAGSAARFNNPYGLTLDGSGNIYIGDTYNETIQKMTPAGVVTTIGGTGGVTGTQGGVGPAAAFNAPEGLCVSPTNGAIYVADSANNRISEGIPTGVGQYTWSNFIGNPAIEGGTDGTGSGALLDNPIDVTLDGSGNLLVVSSNGETVRRATPAGVVTTIAGVNATPGSANGTGSTARFYAPNGIGLDLSGNAFVVDSAYSTIREVTPAGVVTTVAGSPANYGYADGTGSLAQFHYPNGAATDTGGDPGYSNPFNVIDIPNLSVSPSTGLSASGTEGGPFSPATTLYTISNVGTGPMSWSVSGTSGWLTYVPPGGTIASGSSIPLSVTINSFANTLIPGSYGDTINFTNTTNGLGDTTLPAALNIFQQYQPVITSTLNAMGVPGVPFTYQILATNAPTSYNASSLPTGLTVNTSNGLITGTTSTSGTSDVTIYASNAAGTGSASLILVIQSSFASWQARWFSPVQLANAAISGATATPAGDGIPNLLKYALNLNPFTNGTSGLPVGSSVTIGGRIYPILTYT